MTTDRLLCCSQDNTLVVIVLNFLNLQNLLFFSMQVVGISTDSHHTHLAWIRTPRDQGGLGGISFPLVADISKEISFEYGVLVEDEKDPLYGAALRGIFIIDTTGKIR